MTKLEQREKENQVLAAAVAWWHNKRPLEWTEQHHLECHWINTIGSVERRLALAVSEYVSDRYELSKRRRTK